MKSKINKIGELNSKIKTLLSLDSNDDENIYIGESNIEHIKNKHYDDYCKYMEHLPSIISNPDYVGTNPKDNSIEYVKEFMIDNKYVKVAVRVSNSKKYFVRSMYTLNNNRVKSFIEKEKLKKYWQIYFYSVYYN